MGAFDTMPPGWNDDNAADAGLGIQPNPATLSLDPTDADPSQAGVPPSALSGMTQSPTTNAAAQALQAAAASDPSIFSRVSQAYQDAQKQGLVGDSASTANRASASAPSQGDDADDGDGDDSDDSSAPSSQSKDYLKDLLSKIYGKDLTDDALKAAMAKRDQLHGQALMSKAGIQLGAALSRGAIKPDYSIQDDMLKNADQGVKDILARRDAKMKDMEAGLKASDLADHEKLRDPGSDISAAYRNMALQLNPKLADQPDFQNMSAEGIKQTLPMVDMSIRMQMLQAQKAALYNQKLQMDQAKAKADMSTRIATALNRGAPAKAMDVDRRVDNVMSLTNMYPDLNKMPQNQVNALTDEIAQIVTGGMSTEGKAAKLMNPTLASEFSNLMSRTEGKPTGAQLGPFVQAYLPYMKDLQTNARSFVRDQINPIMTGYNKRLAPGDIDEYKSSFARYLDPNYGKDATSMGKMPKVGDVEDGHKYIGGDPSKPTSWESVQ